MFALTAPSISTFSNAGTLRSCVMMLPDPWISSLLQENRASVVTVSNRAVFNRFMIGLWFVVRDACSEFHPAIQAPSTIRPPSQRIPLSDPDKNCDRVTIPARFGSASSTQIPEARQIANIIDNDLTLGIFLPGPEKDLCPSSVGVHYRMRLLGVQYPMALDPVAKVARVTR